MPVTLTPISSGYTGRYTTAAEVTTFLDSQNFTVHTDADRDGSSDAAAVEQGIKTAEGRIDLRAGGPYTFAVSAAGDAAEAVFNHWAYKLASYEYAAKRGIASNSENEFVKIRDEVFEEIALFVADRDSLPGAIPPAATDEADEWEVQDAPLSIPATVDRDGRDINETSIGAYWDANLGGWRY